MRKVIITLHYKAPTSHDPHIRNLSIVPVGILRSAVYTLLRDIHDWGRWVTLFVVFAVGHPILFGKWLYFGYFPFAVEFFFIRSVITAWTSNIVIANFDCVNKMLRRIFSGALFVYIISKYKVFLGYFWWRSGFVFWSEWCRSESYSENAGKPLW